MYDVVALGELLIDFVSDGSDRNTNGFIGNPGGAPANVLVALAKMGRRGAFIGKVGRDQFGTFLEKTLHECAVETNGLVFSNTVNTTLAFVHLDSSGDRNFTFYRNPGADATLSENEIHFELIRNAKVFHFGSISMTHDIVRQATLRAVEYAKRFGVLISYDPNLRLPLWESSDQAKSVISSVISSVDILKLSEEELRFLTDESNLEIGTLHIYEDYKVELILVTLGENGCFYRFNHQTGYVPGVPMQVVDTTGAGDAFIAGILHKMVDLEDGFSNMSLSIIEEFIRFANVVAALSTMKKGGIPSMPSLEDVNNYSREHQSM